jgi:hypothetical protein
VSVLAVETAFPRVTIAPRQALPRATDRLVLGVSGLMVSPLCLGMTADPRVVPAAFDAGVNFFFVSADLHWPLYDGLRRGLRDLFARGGGVRDEVVVGVVSYLEQPMFQHLQFHEVVSAVPGLDRADLLIAGAIPHGRSLGRRLDSLQQARARGHCGGRAVGASFHDRATAVAAVHAARLDMHYVRYNTAHPGARDDLFPFVPTGRSSLIFNFKSLLSVVTPERFARLGLRDRWLPEPTDYYRFVLSHPVLDGVLCSPMTVGELDALVWCLHDRPLDQAEADYMVWLSALAETSSHENSSSGEVTP